MTLQGGCKIDAPCGLLAMQVLLVRDHVQPGRMHPVVSNACRIAEQNSIICKIMSLLLKVRQ